nr:non-ribosomal peptide synthetase [Paenibacillus sp. MMS18-CY102]
MFVNTLAMRNAPSGEKSFHAYVQEVKENALRAYENQDYQFEELVNKLDVARDVSRNPLFDTMFILQNTEQSELSMGDLKCIPYPLEHHVAKFDLTFILVEEAEGITCSIEYASSLYKRETVERMAQHFKQLIDVIVKDPQTKLSAIEMITPDEKRQILEVFNGTVADYPRDKTIHQLFEEQVERTPDQVAVVYEGSQLTYGELNEKANRLARRLRAEGVQPDQPIGILVERSLEMMVGIYAILKAGGVYVPIDPDYPDERIRFILEDSGAKLLLTREHLLNHVSFAETILNLDDPKVYTEDGQNLEPMAGPNNIAYVIYTSGSTGKPKGVMIEHHSVLNRILWMHERYPIGEQDTILQKTAFTFDVSVWELFWWAMVGAKVCLLSVGGEKNPATIVETIERYQITTMHFVPAMLHAFLEVVEQSKESTEKLKSLRQIFASGEALSPQHVARFQQAVSTVNHAKLINLYGPTEATVDVSYFDCEPDQENHVIPIGKPIHNIRLYIFQEGTVQLQPIGVAGELCIAGVGVARGYLNRPELNAEKFVEDPFVPDERMYRTGDLTCWMPDGNIEYLGRIDHQVKIRGYRIELGEIETQLMKLEAVQEAVVTAREDESGQKQLCAYFVSEEELMVSDLRVSLSVELPSYMVPSYFIQMDKIPFSPNGKIDRKALPAPERGMQTGTEHVAPRTSIEAQLAQIWQEVLGLERIGIKDNFFDVGGHSLKVLQLTQKIHTELGIDIPLHVVFEMPSIEEMANELLKRQFYTFEQKKGNNIIKLNEHGLINVFCFPPILGYGIVFAEMAKHLEHHCVVHAIEFIEGTDDREEMLEQYVDSIVSVQDKAPYIFLGYSAGGNLAFEVAKVMEKRGYEVSDIIMVDSFRKHGQIEIQPEEVDNHLTQIFEIIPEPYKQVLTAPVTREKVRQKTHAYHKYWNQLVNAGVIHASIHGLVAVGTADEHSTHDDVLLWKQATHKTYAEHKVIGEHLEILSPGFVEENAKVLQRIVKNIYDYAELNYFYR